MRREIERKGRKAQTALETMTAIDKAGGCGNCFHKIMNELRAVWRNRKSSLLLIPPLLLSCTLDLSLFPFSLFSLSLLLIYCTTLSFPVKKKKNQINITSFSHFHTVLLSCYYSLEKSQFLFLSCNFHILGTGSGRLKIWNWVCYSFFF